MPEVNFTVLGKVEPQGSIRAFVIQADPKAGRSRASARLTSTNPKMKPWRQQIGWTALAARNEAGWRLQPKEVPFRLDATFYIERPKSITKSRTWPTVKPDYDKLTRAATDALTGVLWTDDAQVVQATIQKRYGSPARAVFTVRTLPPATEEANHRKAR
jgi:Holliday junction resolvase RusA-like endonuclease